MSAAAQAGALLVLVAGAYAAVVLLLGRAPDGGERAVLGLSMAATIAVALLYPPVRQRAVRWARRLGVGARPPLDEPLRLFTGRLSRAIPLDELLLQTAEALRRSLDLRAAEIWTGSAGELERGVSDPDRGPAWVSLGAEQPIVAREGVAGEAFAAMWLAPLLEGRGPGPLRVAPAVRAGELLGLVVAEREPGAPPFGEREEEMLGELGRRIALALHNARLDSALQASLEALRRQADELRASRARVVAAADAERRRIERDLHDGAQQRLVALMVALEEGRALMRSDPEGARTALADLKRELGLALEEIRDLARGIYPPLLSDGGLSDALPAAAARTPLACRVDVNGIGRYPAEVETAVYFCCLEALQNASKHAGRDAQATIAVRELDDGLEFVVEDDGLGFEPDRARAGSGLTGMRDRIGAVGGQLEVASVPGGGARVRGLVPLTRSPPTDKSAPPSRGDLRSPPT